MKYGYDEIRQEMIIIFENGEVDEGILFIKEMAEGLKNQGEINLAAKLRSVVYQIRIYRKKLGHS